MGKHTCRIVAVIPAHNEQDNVGHTVASLQHQTVPPDRVLVVSDNSADDTVQAAKDAGADTMVTTGQMALLPLVHRGRLSARANSLGGVVAGPWDAELSRAAEWYRIK